MPYHPIGLQRGCDRKGYAPATPEGADICCQPLFRDGHHFAAQEAVRRLCYHVLSGHALSDHHAAAQEAVRHLSCLCIRAQARRAPRTLRGSRMATSRLH